MGSAGNGINSSLSHQTEEVLLQKEAGHFQGLEASLKPEERPEQAVGQLGVAVQKREFQHQENVLFLQTLSAGNSCTADNRC